MPFYYKRYLDDHWPSSAANFIETFNHCRASVKFTMEMKNNSILPFLGTQLLNRAPRVETKVYVKPTNIGLCCCIIYNKSCWWSILARPVENHAQSPISINFLLVLLLRRMRSLERIVFSTKIPVQSNYLYRHAICRLESLWPARVCIACFWWVEPRPCNFKG